MLNGFRPLQRENSVTRFLFSPLTVPLCKKINVFMNSGCHTLYWWDFGEQFAEPKNATEKNICHGPLQLIGSDGRVDNVIPRKKTIKATSDIVH